ncbi:hypothetical protein ACFSUS_13350 [Spirosoma soli]|uniref:J domain-containing protein n=1 Tax=Spirosoma soli TaxID=1770529 RepID=A0ABW5M3L7_9BACT
MSLVRTSIVSIQPSDKTPLTKEQKEFNRLTEQVSELEQQVASFRAATASLHQRIYSEYEPLLRSYQQLRAQLVRLFDRAYERTETTRAEKKKLAGFISDLAHELIDQPGFEDLRPIFDKYTSDLGVDEKSTFQPPTPAQPKPHTQQDHATQQDTGQAKSTKQQKREARKQLEQRNITKAVRTLYVDLVKAFHPDRELDEAEKIRKTAIMQRVTEAYEKSDLFALLGLQFEFDHIDQRHLSKLAKEQLHYYNKILQQQVDDLSNELDGLRRQLAAVLGRSVAIKSIFEIEFSFNNDVRALKKSVKALKNEVRSLSDPAVLTAWLKACKL